MSKDNKKVRVAIIGVGNCASALVQGLQYYKDAADDAEIPGLMHARVGGYHVRDIEISAAIDVVEGKVGKDVSEAIWAEPNNTIKFAEVPHLNVPVSRGMTHDGIGKYVSTMVTKAPGPTDNIVKVLKDTGTDVVVNFMPVGSEMATKWYVEQALDAGCAFVNGIPVFIASSPYWSKRFEERGLPIVGDDIKSQVGATITHRVLTNLFNDRGIHLDREAERTPVAVAELRGREPVLDDLPGIPPVPSAIDAAVVLPVDDVGIGGIVGHRMNAVPLRLGHTFVLLCEREPSIL